MHSVERHFLTTGCMRAECPHPEKCAEAWKCLNPMHPDRSDHGVVRPITDRVSRIGGNGRAGSYQSLEANIRKYISDLRRTPSGGSANDIANELECLLETNSAGRLVFGEITDEDVSIACSIFQTSYVDDDKPMEEAMRATIVSYNTHLNNVKRS